MSIFIPVSKSKKQIEVQCDSLPDDAEEILSILKAELAPLDVWLEFAIEYYTQGKIDQFLAILSVGSSSELESFYGDCRQERVAILNTLAAYYTQLAINTPFDQGKRDHLFSQATQAYNKADRIMIREDSVTWVGKGVMMLWKGDLGHALQSFETALENSPVASWAAGNRFQSATTSRSTSTKLSAKQAERVIPAMLGKACLLYTQKRYDDALKLYQRILATNRNVVSGARFGIALCLFQLGNFEMSRKALKRVIELDPDHVDALIALAMHKLNDMHAIKLPAGSNNPLPESTIDQALKLIYKAHQLNPYHARTLNLLARHYSVTGEWSKCVALAQQAYKLTSSDQIKAESTYYLARAAHAQEDYEQAFNYYQESVKLSGDDVSTTKTTNSSDTKKKKANNELAHFGLGQMMIWKRRDDLAVKHFERVLSKYRDNYDALKMLGALYARQGNTELALKYFRRVVELAPNDVSACIQFAQLIESSNPTGALNTYQKAAKQRGKNVDPNLHNNIGVLLVSMRRYEEAEQAFLSAIEASGHDIDDYHQDNVTITYNLARCFEHQGQLDRAMSLYKEILQEHPHYTDCFLRLGCMHRDQGQLEEATKWFNNVFKYDPNNANAMILLANIQIANNQWGKAQKHFEKVASKVSKNDPYATLALGNIQYEAKYIKNDRSSRFVDHAEKFYTSVLKRFPKNIYAANGLGVVMAEKGYMTQAKDIFLKVREAKPDFQDVWMNLGLVYLSQRQFVSAVQMFRHALEKFSGSADRTTRLFLHLGKAYFEDGQYEQCKQTLLHAIHQDPANDVLWFNLALTQESYSMNILRAEKKTLAQTKDAIEAVRGASQLFNKLSQSQDKRRQFSTASARQHYDYCQNALNQATAYIQAAEKQDQIEKQAQAERKAAAAERKRMLEAKRQQEYEAKVREQQEKLAAVEQARQKEEELKEKWGMAANANKKRPRREKKTKAMVDDAPTDQAPSLLDDDDDDDQGGQDGLLDTALDELGHAQKKQKTMDDDEQDGTEQDALSRLREARQKQKGENSQS